MDNPPKVTAGDRVRVVLEGEVTPTPFESGHFDIALWGGSGNCIKPEAEHVVSIEVLAKPPKVGDTIPGDRADELPVGSVVLYEYGGGASLRRRDGQWATKHDTRVGQFNAGVDLKVLHLGTG